MHKSLVNITLARITPILTCVCALSWRQHGSQHGMEWCCQHLVWSPRKPINSVVLPECCLHRQGSSAKDTVHKGWQVERTILYKHLNHRTGILPKNQMLKYDTGNSYECQTKQCSCELKQTMERRSIQRFILSKEDTDATCSSMYPVLLLKMLGCTYCYFLHHRLPK